MRVCSTPGCPELTKARRCATHASEYEQGRGTRQQRGYGHDHEVERAKWQRILNRRPWPCARCEVLIQIGEPWDLGHDDLDRTKWVGPEHPVCNRAAGGRAAHGTS